MIRKKMFLLYITIFFLFFTNSYAIENKIQMKTIPLDDFISKIKIIPAFAIEKEDIEDNNSDICENSQNMNTFVYRKTGKNISENSKALKTLKDYYSKNRKYNIVQYLDKNELESNKLSFIHYILVFSNKPISIDKNGFIEYRNGDEIAIMFFKSLEDCKGKK